MGGEIFQHTHRHTKKRGCCLLNLEAMTLCRVFSSILWPFSDAPCISLAMQAALSLPFPLQFSWYATSTYATMTSDPCTSSTVPPAPPLLCSLHLSCHAPALFLTCSLHVSCYAHCTSLVLPSVPPLSCSCTPSAMTNAPPHLLENYYTVTVYYRYHHVVS